MKVLLWILLWALRKRWSTKAPEWKISTRSSWWCERSEWEDMIWLKNIYICFWHKDTRRSSSTIWHLCLFFSSLSEAMTVNINQTLLWDGFLDHKVNKLFIFSHYFAFVRIHIFEGWVICVSDNSGKARICGHKNHFTAKAFCHLQHGLFG